MGTAQAPALEIGRLPPATQFFRERAMVSETLQSTAVARMTEAAQALLSALDSGQRSRATYPFDDHAERVRWYYFPAQQGGLPLGDMTAAQRRQAHQLLQTGLSSQAYARATQVISLESVLGQIEGTEGMFERDPGLYFVSIFGEPSASNSWGWRFNGHHVCINHTIVDGELVAATPMFLGSNPARVRHEGFDIVRLFGDSEDIALELLDALTPQLREAAMVSARAPMDILLGNLPHPAAPHARKGVPGLPATFGMPGNPEAQSLLDMLYYDVSRPIGLASDKMTAGQRELLARLVRHYASRFPEGLPWNPLDQLERLHFAWAGSAEPGRPHYYRIQGEQLLVEFDNVQNGANHVHTVCRHTRDDFGATALGLHYLWDHASPKG